MIDPEHSDDLAAATAVRRGVTVLARRLRAERPVDGLSLNKLSVLSHLYRRGPMTPGELAAADRLQPQSLTRVLAELELADLVVRSRSEDDRRQFLIELTRPGLDALARDMRQRDAWLRSAMVSLSPTEREVLRLAGVLMEQLAGEAAITSAPAVALGVA